MTLKAKNKDILLSMRLEFLFTGNLSGLSDNQIQMNLDHIQFRVKPIRCKSTKKVRLFLNRKGRTFFV